MNKRSDDAADRKSGQYSYPKPPTGIAHDLDTSRDQLTAEALNESEQRFRQISELSPTAILINRITDPRIIYCNAHACEFFGLPFEELLGRSIINFYYDPEERLDFLERLREQGGIHNRVMKFLDSQENIKWGLVSIQPIKYGGEQSLLGVVADITDRKLAEDALRETKLLLDSAIESFSDGFVLFDSNDRFVLANSAYLDSHPDIPELRSPGEKFETVVRRLAEIGFYGNTPEEIDAITQTRLERHRSGEPFEYRTGDGQWFQMNQYRTADGGTALVRIDITERKTIEQQLAHAQKMEAVGQLTGGIAHDFNNVLQLIQTSLELVQGDLETDETAKKRLGVALESVQRGKALTHQLLAFARKQTLHPEIVEPNKLVKGLLKLLGPTLGKQIKFEKEFEEDLPAIEIDPNSLQNAVVNLANNAKSAMPDGGTLTFKTAKKHLEETRVSGNGYLPAGSYVEISVSDDGCGMSPEMVERVIEPFFSTKDAEEGSGLGLSMVFGFVRQSGGAMSIESVLGRGTTVTLTFPVAKIRAARQELETEKITTEPGKGTILVVEDDSDVRKAVVEMLKAHGYETREAGDAFFAMEAMSKDDRISLLFSDVVMPRGITGLELAQEATRINDNLKVLLTSAHTDSELEKSGVVRAPFPLLKKPFSKEELSAAIKAALDG